jgi:hypothetical protein
VQTLEPGLSREISVPFVSLRVLHPGSWVPNPLKTANAGAASVKVIQSKIQKMGQPASGVNE